MGKTYEIVVEKDQELKDVIYQFILTQGWERAYISGAVGSLQSVELTTPIKLEFPPQVEVFRYEGPAEILNFTGEVMPKEKMDPAMQKIYAHEQGPLFAHIHASIAVPGSRVYGGGFQKGRAFLKVKVFIHSLE